MPRRAPAVDQDTADLEFTDEEIQARAAVLSVAKRTTAALLRDIAQELDRCLDGRSFGNFVDSEKSTEDDPSTSTIPRHLFGAVKFLRAIADAYTESIPNNFVPKSAWGLNPDEMAFYGKAVWGDVLVDISLAIMSSDVSDAALAPGSPQSVSARYLLDIQKALDSHSGIWWLPDLDRDQVIEVFFKKHDEKASRLPDHIEERVLTLDGERYLSVPDAAKLAQVPLSSFHSWINNGTEFNGSPLRTVFLNGINRNVVSEESVLRAANRFVKWPSKEQAGAVTLGETADGIGYIGMKEAASQLSISRPTMNLWASDHTKSPLKRPLDVIKDIVSGQLHIHESEVRELSDHLAKNGLRPGRPRLQLT